MLQSNEVDDILNNTDPQRIPTNLSDIKGFLEVLTSVPTLIPKKFSDSIKIFNDTIYFFNPLTNTWINSTPAPTTIAGKIYLSGTQTISNNTITAITLDTSEIDEGVNIDLANNKIIVETAGYYAISGQICWSQSTDAKNYKSYIVKNSTEIITGFSHASVTGSYYITSPLNTIIYLAAGDYVKLYCNQVSGGSQTVAGGSNYSYLSIHKI